MLVRFLFVSFTMVCFPYPGNGQEPLPAPAAVNTTNAFVVPQLRNTAVPVPENGKASEKTAGLVDFQKCLVPNVSAKISIHNDLASTRLQFRCVNSSEQSVSAPIAVPLPYNANCELPASESKAEYGAVHTGNASIVPADRAMSMWQDLSRQLNDPAPIEFCGSPLLKTDPVELSPGESQPLDLLYTFTCPSSAPRYDYLLPRSESVQYVVPWSIEVDLNADQPISTVYSPTHKLQTKRLSANSLQVKLDDNETLQPGGFWLSYLVDHGGLSGTLFTQPDDSFPEADGTFLFLAGLPATLAEEKTIPRDLTLALDCSGSMQGPKMSQVREAATGVLEGLKEGESFNIITYNDKIQSFAKEPVAKTAESLKAALEFVDSVQPRGGTNLHGALLESVKQKPAPQTLPLVLFLTDGLPTVGETRESQIRKVIDTQNPYNRRIFTVGVGVDVNTPLLEGIATDTRAQPTFVLPEENVKTKVSQVFKSWERPILADASLSVLNPNGNAEPSRVKDVFPDPLPDLFQEDQLVVLGRYRGEEPLVFRVAGNYLGQQKTFEFTFPVKDQPEYGFVSRLWARQKIAALVQAIRKSGATADPYEILANPKQNPELKALSEEVLKLSTRYGILTEYTAFLANQDNRLQSPQQQVEMAYQNFDQRAVKTRVGISSVNQSINNSLQKRYILNGNNYYYDANMDKVTVPNVQQFGNGAYFLRGDTWVEGKLLDRPHLVPAERVTFGSPAYRDLVNQLVLKREHAPLSLGENVLLEIENKPVLFYSPKPVVANSKAAVKLPASTAPQQNR